MRTVLDVSPLWRSSIGFDRMLGLLDEVTRAETAENYPPYDIEKTGEDAYRISLAVAGFSPDELSITQEGNLLMVSGKKADSPERQYLHHGIATRAFERQFTLADFVKVTDAQLEQGLLTIGLIREVPEAMKPRRVAIANSNRPQAIESKQAA
jgi:molecular chaperone IbpA